MNALVPPPQESSKAKVLELLKSRTCLSTQQLACALNITLPAARRHLQDLQQAGLLVASTEKPGGRGRPQRVYHLTEQGEAAFPKRYASLCVDVLRHVQNLFGEGAVLQVMDARRAELEARWAAELTGPLRTRLARLAELLNEAGYGAQVEEEAGQLYLVQANCPSPAVAKAFEQVCAAEQTLYTSLLGVPVTRESRIVCGAACCRYRIGSPDGA